MMSALLKTHNPLVVGVAGGTGSGKTTFARAILAKIGVTHTSNVAFISHDSYYKDITHLTMAERDLRNFDHPDALDTTLLVEHIKQLKDNKSVEIPQYSFETHGRLPTTTAVPPSPVVIVEGILIFSDPRLVELMDIKVFVDLEADIRVLRRLQRDVSERGRSVESVISQYLTTVKPMHEQYVEPSKAKADIIVPGVKNEVGVEIVANKIISSLGASLNQVCVCKYCN